MKTIYMSADGTWVQDWNIELEEPGAFPQEPEDLWDVIPPGVTIREVLTEA